MTHSSLSVKALHKSFYSPTQVAVLKGLDLDIEEGQAVAIMGKSGEGKSTLLHLIGTLEKPCSGTITLLGRNTEELPSSLFRQKYIGFIFQSYNLLEEQTVLENLLMPAAIARFATHVKSIIYQRALELLEEVGLSERANFPAKLLSGGEKQRAAIARALINNPSLILADEPSGNLDESHSQIIHHMLLTLVKKHRKMLLIATHDQALATLCNKIYTLKNGILQ